MHRREFLRAGAGVAASVALRPLGAGGQPAARAHDAAVTVHPARELGRIDPLVYGHQLEHLERVVYGGVFDPGSPRADALGLRRDVIGAMREMGGARVIRWPGGNFVSYYHWEDGVGPRARRPRRYDVVWRNQESNHFGTDEYLALCRAMECEPFITANMGNGTIEEACRWVEYCRHQRREPPARIWGLGNEHFGPWQVGHYTAEEYGRKAAQFAQFMRAVSPDLRFVGVGTHRFDPRWNETVLRHVGAQLEWLSFHVYGHRYHRSPGADAQARTPEADFDQAVATPAFFEQELRALAGQLEEAERGLRRETPLRICLEEWNTRHTVAGRGLVRESPRDVADALFVAGVFNACQRLAERVTMTNYIYFVNAHAPIEVTRDGLLRSATFDVFRLYATRMQPVAVAADVRGETFAAEMPAATRRDGRDGAEARVAVGRVDVSATRSVDGRAVVLSLLNRDRARPARVALAVAGRGLPARGTLHTLTGPSPSAVNTREAPNAVRASTREVALAGGLELPPASVNVLELRTDAE
jgi:alpha-N-arabinofuranosidase